MTRTAFIIYALALVLLSRCYDDKSPRIFTINDLMQKYNPVAVNYFFELAFYQDYVGPRDFLSKWTEDILISMEGDLWPNDSTYVANVIKEIKSLNLPLDVVITKDTAKANLRVFFGNYNYLENKLGLEDYIPFLGIGRLQGDASVIKTAKVGIANNANTYKRLTAIDSSIIRQSYILEEITQCLGLTGDSWLNQKSIFYEGKRPIISLQELDKQTLKFLYEPSIPAGYTRQQFETDFNDVLYHKYPKRKIVKHVNENNVPVRYLERIFQSSFTTPLYKYSGPTFVLLKGDVQPQDIDFCKRAIEKLNAVSDQFYLTLAPDDIWHQQPTITLQFNDSSLQENVYAHRSMIRGEMMVTRRIVGNIKISYKKSDSIELQAAKNKLVFTSLYKILGLDNITGEIADIDSMGNITFKPDYQEILALLYNPVIPNGFTKKEMEEVIAELKKK